MRYLFIILFLILGSVHAHARTVTLNVTTLTKAVAEDFHKKVVAAHKAGQPYDTVLINGCKPVDLLVFCGGRTDGALLSAHTVRAFGLKTIAKGHVVSAGAIPFLAGRSPTILKGSSVTVHGMGNWFDRNYGQVIQYCYFKIGLSPEKCSWIMTAGTGKTTRKFLKLTPDNARAAGFKIIWR